MCVYGNSSSRTALNAKQFILDSWIFFHTKFRGCLKISCFVDTLREFRRFQKSYSFVDAFFTDLWKSIVSLIHYSLISENLQFRWYVISRRATFRSPLMSKNYYLLFTFKICKSSKPTKTAKIDETPVHWYRNYRSIIVFA